MKRFGCNRRRGFTLTELLIVLAILVMLAALAVPAYLRQRKKAYIGVAKTQVETLRNALKSYAADTNEYPTTEQGLQVLIAPPAEADDSTVTGWDGPYLDKDTLPKDPWGNDYQYEYSGEEGSFPKIWSMGPDKESGTEDDICSWTRTEGEEGQPGETTDQDVDVDVNVDLGPTKMPSPPGPTGGPATPPSRTPGF